MTRDEDLAKLAARLTDQLGEELVNAYRDRIRIRPPQPGVAVLACRCGVVLDAADMHRVLQPRVEGSSPAVERIACRVCAAQAMHGLSIATVIRELGVEGGGAWSPTG
jgi:hypothetical protein